MLAYTAKTVHDTFFSHLTPFSLIHGSGPVMRRPSMDRRASGISFIFEPNGQPCWNFKPEQRWNIFPDSAANNVQRFGCVNHAAVLRLKNEKQG